MNARRKPGFSAVEVMVAVMVAATVGLPLLTLLMQERDTEQRSRFEYLAILAARDAAYTARALVACGAKQNEVMHGMEALTKNPPDKGPFDRLKPVFVGNTPDVKYGPDQSRISTEVKGDFPTPAAPVSVGVVSARWVDPDLAAAQKRRTQLDLVFGMSKPPGVP
jgi:type II secretory pathway pseudopilin PulG